MTEVTDLQSESPACGHSACRQNWIDTGESECVQPQVDVTLHLRVYDPYKFAAAAVAQAIKDGVDPEEAASTYTEDNLTGCARMIFDPGQSPPGCQIEDSSAIEAGDVG